MRSSRAAEKIFGAAALRAEMVEERVVPLTEKCGSSTHSTGGWRQRSSHEVDQSKGQRGQTPGTGPLDGTESEKRASGDIAGGR